MFAVFAAALAIALLLVIFRLGNQASAGVSLSDPVVWVEDGSNGRLLQINGSTREITAEVEVGDNGDSIVAFPRGRDAVFLNRNSGEIGVVGAISLSVDSAEAVSQTNPVSGPQLQLLADFDAEDWINAFVLDDSRTFVFEPGGGLRQDIPNGELGDTVVNSDGQLLAVTGDASLVGITTERGLETLVTLPALISPDAQHPGLVRSGDSIYLVDSERRVVNEILGQEDLGPDVSICGSLSDVSISGNTLTSSDGARRILVHDSEAGLLSVSEPDESDCVLIVLGESGTNWGPPVAVDSTAYLPNYNDGEIVVVDLEERVVVDTFAFGSANGVPFELEVFDGAVWANEPQGIRAAVVSRDEIEEIIKLGSVSVGDDDPDSEGGVGRIVTEGQEDDLRGFGNEGDLFQFGEDGGPGGGAGVAVDANEPEDDQDLEDATPTTADASDPTGDAETDAISDQLPVDLPDTPFVVPVEEELTGAIDELIANFDFTADTINVGEEVGLTDQSTGNPTSWNWDFGDGTGGSGPEVTKVWGTEGVFTVTLLVANGTEEQAQQTHEFTVVAVDVLRVPTADFSFRSDTIEVGEEIVFTNTSTGDPDTLQWDLGDGTTANSEQVVHEFSEPGEYPVTLTASNAAGPNSTTAVITVIAGVQPPTAIIGSFPGVVEVGQSVALSSESTNSPTAISWGFDDGDTALGESVRHAWTEPGTYRIRLSVSNSGGADEAFADIVVEPRISPPVARFGQSTLEIVQGETINFSDLSLNSPTSSSWEFGDGSTGQGANVSHSWDEPGSYTVTLTSANGAGSDSTSKTVTVAPLPPNPPTAAFNITNATVPVNSVVSFTDASTGDPTSWLWDFGDGGSSRAQNPPHGFNAPGTYTITLTATNAGGSTSMSRQLVVVDPPVASFTQVADELAVVFTDTSVNSPTDWQWTFGDGTSSTAQNPSKSYAEPGIYTVRLIAGNDAGNSTPFVEVIEVVQSPVAAFTHVENGLTVVFDNNSFNNPTNSTWDFGDGNTSSAPNPSHTFAVSGTYTVELTVTNGGGEDTTAQQVIVELAPPVASFDCNVIGGGVACNGTPSTSAAAFSWSAPGSIAQNGTATSTPSFTYTNSDTFDITLTVTNTEGVSNSTTRMVVVTVPEPPTITSALVLTNNNGVVELSASALNSPTSWAWTAPGGVISGGNSGTPSITYDSEGPFTATVTASNAVGTSAPVEVDFTIDLSTPPVITSIGSTSNSGGVIALTAAVTNAPTSYTWTTSGGTLSSASAANPTLTVTSNGSYTVTLVVSNGDGTDSDMETFQVTDIAEPPPVVGPVSVGAEGPAGSVGVSATATNSPTSWLWTVNGSTQGTSTQVAPTFNFTTDGLYNGTVTASNAGGTSQTQTFQIVIDGFPDPVTPPTASFTSTVNGTTADFTFTGTDPGTTSFTWTFQGGSPPTSNAENPAGIDFGAPGTYNVTLFVSNGGGSDTAPGTVTIP